MTDASRRPAPCHRRVRHARGVVLQSVDAHPAVETVLVQRIIAGAEKKRGMARINIGTGGMIMSGNHGAHQGSLRTERRGGSRDAGLEQTAKKGQALLSNAIREAAAMAVVALAMSRWYARRSRREPIRPTGSDFWLSRPPASRPGFAIEWNKENIGKLKALGFTVIQVDVAWTRPDDEILNIEDIVELSAEEQKDYPQPVPLRSKTGSRESRRAPGNASPAHRLGQRGGPAHAAAGRRPYNAHARYGDNPPNCILDERTSNGTS